MAKTSAVAKNMNHMDHMKQRIMSDHQLPSVQFSTDCFALNFQFSCTPQGTMPQKGKRKAKKIKERGGKNIEQPSPFFTDHCFKNKEKANLFVHRILHVLLNYSYIAILYSICQCTVQNVCPKKRREKKINDIVNQTRWDSTSCVEEKQGATESVGNCRNWHVLSGELFSSAALLLRSTSLCILTWSVFKG